MNVASLLLPALRWDAAHGFSHLEAHIADCLELGVGGFVIRGGPRDAITALTGALQAASPHTLLLASDAERGAAMQYAGTIGLPPLLALGALRGTAEDPAGAALEAFRRAGRVTARELKSLGITWALAPVCDLDIAPYSPIVGTRAAGNAPQQVGALVGEWIDACQAEGVLACAKHFPGHGRAAGDSHRVLPSVPERADVLWRDDLAPFRAAIDAGVGSVMTAHVAFPALDPSGLPATLSAPMLNEILRETMQFDGLIASDAIEMDGILQAGAEIDVAVRAVAAGCDVLLAPLDAFGVARALERALASGALPAQRVHDAIERRHHWAGWAAAPSTRPVTLDDQMWARQVADQTIVVLRGEAPRIGDALEIVIVDDDADGPWENPSRGAFRAMFAALDVAAQVVAEPSGGTRIPVLIALFADVIAWKGTATLSEESHARVVRASDVARAQHRHVSVVLFGHPRLVHELPEAENVVCAWGGEGGMQEAAARRLSRG